MANPSQTIARVYAQALYEVAESQGLIGQVLDDLRVLHDVIWTSGGRQVREFVLSPRVDRERKWALLGPVLEGRVSRPVLGLMRVVIQKGRESILDNIAVQFERFSDLAENRTHAYVTVAAPLDAALLESVRLRLEAEGGKTVLIHEEVVPEVLGGAAIRVGDRVIDRTLRTRLAALRKHLLASAPQR